MDFYLSFHFDEARCQQMDRQSEVLIHVQGYASLSLAFLHVALDKSPARWCQIDLQDILVRLSKGALPLLLLFRLPSHDEIP